MVVVYVFNGKEKVVGELVFSVKMIVEFYLLNNYVYGLFDWDEVMIFEMLLLMNC